MSGWNGSSGYSDERSPLIHRGGTSTSGTRQASHSRYTKERLLRLNCFTLIHRITKDIESLCDTPLSLREFESPRLAYLLIPLQEQYLLLDDVSLIYCLLVCRIHFLEQQGIPSAYSLANSRAALCEILATKIMCKVYDADPESDETLLLLSHAFASAFSPFQGAPDEILQYHEAVDPEASHLELPKGNALELAIMGEAKRLIRSRPVQWVLDAIWTGEVIYSPTSFVDLLPDHYRRVPITLYDAAEEPLLNQQRLIVPRIRAALEYAQFLVLFISYLLVVCTMQPNRMNGWEIWLAIYASGWGLDRFATVLEHGIGVFLSNVWNGIDLAFIFIFSVYLILRLIDITHRRVEYYSESLNVLACGAIVLFPRLVVLVISKSRIILGLRLMFSQFMFILLVAVWCFFGFAVALYLLAAGEFSMAYIGKLMVWTTFGLNGMGIEEASNFHPVLGPIIFVAYAALSSMLMLSTMVSVLSHTFRTVAEDSVAEVLFRHAVEVHEGIKSDAIFLYQPPLNIPAFLILFPLRFFISRRAFHRVNVIAARVFNAPLLLPIAAWERRRTIFDTPRRFLLGMRKRLLTYASPHHDLQLVFEHLPPDLQAGVPQHGLMSNISRDSSADDRRGRSNSPVRPGPRAASNKRSGSRPNRLTLTKMYGNDGGQELDAVTRRLDRLEDILARIEESVKLGGAG